MKLLIYDNVLSGILFDRTLIYDNVFKGVDTSRDLADSADRYYSRFFLHRNGITHRYAAACARERELFAISVFYSE